MRTTDFGEEIGPNGPFQEDQSHRGVKSNCFGSRASRRLEREGSISQTGEMLLLFFG